MNIETIGLGAGSYPDSCEEEIKRFQFNFEGFVEGTGIVYATSYEEAKEKILEENKYDEIDNQYIRIENIKRLEED